MRYSLIILMAISSILAEDAKPQPLEVQNAMAALEKSVIAARKVYDPIVAKAVNDAVLKLNLVKNDYMKNGDLEGANLIVEAIAKLKSGDVVGEIEVHIKNTNSIKLFSDGGIVGTWEATYYNNTRQHVVVSDDMKVVSSGNAGIAIINQEKKTITVKFNNGFKNADLVWVPSLKGFKGLSVNPDNSVGGSVIYKRIPDTK